ncbi:MAG: tyrosine-type recombinase/integrase [Aestuariivirga sp.]
MRQRLTKSVVESVEPGPKDLIVWDRDVKGFGLKVTPKGKRVYFAYYRAANGQQRRPVIGVHGVITAEDARQIAKKWIGSAFAGQDVSQHRQEARSAPLVRELAERYLEEHARPFKKPSSCKTDKSNIEHHVLPLLGKKKVAEVSRRDIEYLKSAIRDGKTASTLKAKRRGRSIVKGGPGVANRVVALMSKMMSCAVRWELRTDNPVLGTERYPERRKDRFLDAPEIARLLEVLRQAEQEETETPDVIACFLLLLFTGLRCGEILNLEWEDIDFTRRTLRLRDSKTGARTVPINKQAIDILGRHAACGKSQFVIRSATGDGRPSLGKPWQRIRTGANIDDTANIHCLRHTFASWAVMGGLSLAQTGALLGHKSLQTTLRYADHLIDVVREYSQKTADLIAAE